MAEAAASAGASSIAAFRTRVRLQLIAFLVRHRRVDGRCGFVVLAVLAFATAIILSMSVQTIVGIARGELRTLTL